MPHTRPRPLFTTLAAALLAAGAGATVRAQEPPETEVAPADRIVAAIDDPALVALLRQVLERNPEIAALEAQARAAAERPAQAAALPDPMAGVTAFLMTPETRVGPQHAMATLSQRFPWFGKLPLKEQAAVYGAAGARARVEAKRLSAVTEARALYYEIAFLDRYADITRTDRETLSHYEELARTRYASGVGLQQAVIKIQAEITKDETRLLDIAKRRADAVARLNAMRDRPDLAEVAPGPIPRLPGYEIDAAALREAGVAARPEVAAANAEIARAGAGADLAKKEYRPDVTVGLTYTLVGRRDDPAGRAMPPTDNGKDILGLSAGINLPVWRKRIGAGVREALESRGAAEEQRRAVYAEIGRAIDDLAARMPLIRSQLRLFDDVLLLQAEESLHSAESAYAAGTASALDLLDAERVFLDVRTSAARTRADYAIAAARLEGAVAGPLTAAASGEDQSHEQH